jgi:NAD(P)-dependent dehydrogenase (short-subunit alcohol dehydrogenase family)
MSAGALAGRIALVTGASKGIGRAVAVTLSEAGATVVVTARSAEPLAALAETIGGYAIAADVTSLADVESLPDRVADIAGGAPGILVNAAGAFALSPFTGTDPAEFERLVRVNLVGPFLVTRNFLGAMLEAGAGHVVTIGSVAGRHPLAGNTAYAASKFGLRGLHEVLALELRGTGVRATLIEPAATDTPLWDSLDPDTRADLPSRDQMLRPEEVAAAVRFVLEQPTGVEVSDLAIRAARG